MKEKQSDLLKAFMFGGLIFEHNNSQLKGFMSKKATALFAYLAYNPQPHPREVLATLFWSDLPNEQALANLRLVVFDLKKQLGAYLHVSRQSIALNQKSALWIDAHEFNQVLTAVTAHDKNYQLPHVLAARLESAISLYRGDFLVGVNLQNADGFDEWLTIERERLRLAAITGLHRFTQDLLERGLYSKGIDFIQRLLGLDPLDETAQTTIIKLLVYDGRTSAALTQFETYRQLLKQELNAVPSQSISHLYTEIQLGNIKPSVSVRFQQIPVPPTTFVPRPREMKLIVERLDQLDCRLLTLTGVGGVGKTRLALQIAADYLTDFAHGVCFISFVSVTHIDFIVPTITRSLGLSEQDDVFEFLRDKELLLIADNFEQLVNGAECLTQILQTAPRVKLLLTSREPLNVLEEWIIQIAEMDYPEQGEGNVALEQYNAAQLFDQIARRVRADFKLQAHYQTVARICKAVQGLPLALEIAAAWTRTLSCEEIADQIEQDIAFLNTPMRNVPIRHQSVHALFDYSWRMLSELEQSVLMRLAVFQDTFSLEAASTVAGASSDILTILSDKALVRRYGERYNMHELVKRYSSEHLGNLEVEVYSSLVDYYLQDIPSWHDRALVGMSTAELVDPEIGNLHSALEWLVNTRDLNRLLRLCDVLDFFWSERGFRSETRYWIAQALALCDDNTPKQLQALTFATAGAQAWALSDLDQAQLLLERAVSLYKEVNDIAGQLKPLMYLGHTAMYRADYAAACLFYAELLVLARSEGNLISQVNALISLGAASVANSDHDSALRHFDEAFEISVQTSEKSHLGHIWEYRGIIAFHQKDYIRAHECFEKRLELARQSGSKPGMLTAYINLGEVAAYTGDYAQARKCFQQAFAQSTTNEQFWEYVALLEGFGHLAKQEAMSTQAVLLFAAADTIRQRLGLPLDPSNQEVHREHLNVLRDELGTDAYNNWWQQGQALSLDEALNHAMKELD